MGIPLYCVGHSPSSGVYLKYTTVWKVDPFPLSYLGVGEEHLIMEMDPVSEMLCILNVLQTMDIHVMNRSLSHTSRAVVLNLGYAYPRGYARTS
jgi:hypothetical protein